MTLDAQALKARMRDDRRAARKQGRTDEVKHIRALVAAIDNAEAPPLDADRKAADQHRFKEGTAEIDRLALGHVQLQVILAAEISEREHAADEMIRIERADRAAALRTGAAMAKRYLGLVE